MYLLYCQDCNRLYTTFYHSSTTYRIYDLLIDHLSSKEKNEEDISKYFMVEGKEADSCSILNEKNITLTQVVVEEDDGNMNFVCPTDSAHIIQMIEIDSSNISLKELKEILSLRKKENGLFYFDLNNFSAENAFKLKRLLKDNNNELF